MDETKKQVSCYLNYDYHFATIDKNEEKLLDCPFCGEDSLTLKNLKYHLKFCCNEYDKLKEED